MNFSITFIVMLYILLNPDQTKARVRTIFDRVEPIQGSKESKMKVLYFRVSSTNNSYGQGEIHVFEDLDSSKLKVVCTVTKCLVAEAPDTCEFLVKLKPLNTCMALNADNMAWSNITGAYTPKFRCPFKKGKYVGDEITFDANMWAMFPLEKMYFKVNFKLYEGDVFTMGIIAEAHVIRVR